MCSGISTDQKTLAEPECLGADVTVVMATYNGARYVAEQIHSLVEQTEQPAEIVIVDDGSDDGTVGIVKKGFDDYGGAFMLIEHDRNQGIAASFADGIKAATRPYVMICDQDDVWCREKIESTVSCFGVEPGIGLVVCDATLVDATLKPLGRTMFQSIGLPLDFEGSKYLVVGPDPCQRLFLKRNYVTGMCLAVRRDIALRALPFPSSMTYDTWLAWVVALAEKVCFLNKPLVRYRQHGGNAIGANRKKDGLTSYYSHRHANLVSMVKKYEAIVGLLKTVEGTCPFSLSLAREALEFYRWRASNTRGVCSRARGAFVYWRRGLYGRYTPNAKVEFAKDIVGAVMMSRKDIGSDEGCY